MEQKREIETNEEPIMSLVPRKDAGDGSLLTREARDMIVVVGDKIGLDPCLGHVILYYGKPYVTEAGMLYYAHRSGKFNGIESRPLTADEREFYQIDQGEDAWIASAWRKGFAIPFTGIGRARADEKNPVARGSFVEHQHPQRMAAKRAEMQALRKAFPVGLPIWEEENEAQS